MRRVFESIHLEGGRGALAGAEDFVVNKFFHGHLDAKHFRPEEGADQNVGLAIERRV